MRTSDHPLLIDTGLGPDHNGEAGLLIGHLRQAGIPPETIDVVVLSHAHGDHTGGAITSEGDPTFPRARYVLSKPEWSFWQAAKDEPGSASAHALLARLASRLDIISPSASILPEITAIPAPGHTPGQIALLLESDGEHLLYVADVIAHPLHAMHPTWNIIADMDREQAVQTRRNLLDWAAAEKIPIYVYHFPEPGPYHVKPKGDGWTLCQPES